MLIVRFHYTIYIILAFVLFAPAIAFSECSEYKIVDHGDNIEAVCVGDSLARSVEISAGDLVFKRGVVFSHKSHQKIYQCKECHSAGNGKITGFGKDYAHTACKGCHAESKRGPIACKDCHLLHIASPSSTPAAVSVTSQVTSPTTTSGTSVPNNVESLQRELKQKELQLRELEQREQLQRDIQQRQTEISRREAELKYQELQSQRQSEPVNPRGLTGSIPTPVSTGSGYSNNIQFSSTPIAQNNEGFVEVVDYKVKYIRPTDLPAYFKTAEFLRTSNAKDFKSQPDLYKYGLFSTIIIAKNHGRQGTISFKLKQVDGSGFEIESLTFSELFTGDQLRTVTSHLPASQLPYAYDDKKWLIEPTKY